MKHSHYKKDVSGLSTIDVYRVLNLFGVTDPCEQHAIKKILCAGMRGLKSSEQDIQEAIDTLERWKEMRAEEATRMPDSFGQKNMIEPASEIDDDSERQLLIQQSGEMAEHVYPAIDHDKFIANGDCRDCGAGPLGPHFLGCKHVTHSLTAHIGGL